jgi:cellulose synthase (UDP-forming)
MGWNKRRERKQEAVKTFLETQSMGVRAMRLVITLLILFLLFQFVSLYFSWPKQIAIGTISIAIVLILNRNKQSQAVTITLMLISIAATLRYGWWRVHLIAQYFSDDSNNPLSIDSVLMLILISAEAYTILIMLLGYMQTVAPLHRRPIPLPVDEALWPDVDILIPTYNESLNLVRWKNCMCSSWTMAPARSSIASPTQPGSGTSRARNTSTPRPATSTTR